MKLPLLAVGSVLLTLVALAPSASADIQCSFYIPPTGDPALVWQVYDFATQTAYDATCGLALDIVNGTCDFALGSACP